MFALPNAPSKGWYTVFFALVSIVEGMALVATPALIRDFSPQVGTGVLYYIFVAFLVVYFATVFGYSEARSNQLGKGFWIANEIALLIAGLASDRLLVRKPFMIVGAAISLIGVGLFAPAATAPARATTRSRSISSSSPAAPDSPT